MRDLTGAARHYGAFAQPCRDLAVADLQQIGCPAILNVKSAPDTVGYDHWALVLPGRDGRLWLFDAPSPLREIAPRDLPPMWSGVALLVSDQPVSGGQIRLEAAARMLPSILMVLCIALAARLVTRLSAQPPQTSHTLQRVGRTAIQGAFLTLLACSLGFASHFLDDDGFLNQASTMVAVEQAHFSDLVRRVTVAQAMRMAESGALVVDARVATDYASGHATGAISLPVDSPTDQRRLALADVPKGRPIAVYCQSRGCPYADRLAKLLAADGYTNLSIVSEGWQGWSQAAPH